MSPLRTACSKTTAYEVKLPWQSLLSRPKVWSLKKTHGVGSVYRTKPLNVSWKRIQSLILLWMLSRLSVTRLQTLIIIDGVDVTFMCQTVLNPRTKEIAMVWLQNMYSQHRAIICFLEICYRIQYITPNGRLKGDPYSLRQTGVYERNNGPQRQSMWIVLQPSQECRQSLEQFWQEPSCSTAIANNPMQMHVLLLSSATLYLDEYVEYLRLRLTPFVRLSIQERKHCW